MATPTRSHAVSTPKSHLPSTPNRPMASPRPGSSAVAQKSLAYKSPAVKTPASAHGHAHTVSVSSQPSSTPLGAAAIHDELLALNSPATALINSIAPTGLTPITSGQDGLGITTSGANGLSTSRDGLVLGNPEAQRLARLQHAMVVLKTKAVGRGITRTSVERVARLQGFEALWDEDNLTIAGNIVEIEINFNPVFKDRITDLILKLNSADGESHTQKDATDILKEEIAATGSVPSSPVEDLESFSNNIKYLAQMDRIAATPNAFEVAGSLYQTFRSIWDEEKKRMSWRSSLQHTRKGAVGNPYFDRKPTLGLSIDYWHNCREIDPVQHREDGPADSGYNRAVISCDSGAPGISASRTWVNPELLVEESGSGNVLDGAQQHFVPDWKDDTLSQLDPAKIQDDQTAVSSTLSVHFSCQLNPEILLPHSVALKLNNDTCPLLIDQSQAMTYQTALQESRNAASLANEANTIESRWSRRLPYVDPSGKIQSKEHSYALYSTSQSSELWVIPISKLTFHHPKQFAAAISVFRQYALVWTLLKTLVIKPVLKSDSASTSSQSAGKGTAVDTETRGSATILPERKRIKKRSNKAQAVTLVDGSSVSEQRDENSLPVDISLDLESDAMKCVMHIFAPVAGKNGGGSGGGILYLAVSIGLDGAVQVGELRGVQASDDEEKEGILKMKVAKMIEATEDLGIVVQWLIERHQA